MNSHYKFDSNGVPILNHKNIEDEAISILQYFDKSVISSKQHVPILDLCLKIENGSDVRFFFNHSLGYDDNNRKILGKCLIHDLRIYIDSSLKDNLHIFNFTLGHEIGHLVLHQGLKIKKPLQPDNLDVIERDFVTGKKKLISANDWLEWHANRFSSALLMPHISFRHAILQCQDQMDIRRNLGFVYVENKKYSIDDFIKIKNKLSGIYKTSPTSIEYRMNDLGILFDDRQKGIKHISELFKKKN